MDEKGRDLLETSVQWVQDEERRRQREVEKAARAKNWKEVQREEPTNGLYHYQGSWGRGIAQRAIKAVIDNTLGAYETTATVVCGTSGCLAGNIVLVAGDEFVFPGTITPGCDVDVDHCIDAEGNIHQIRQRAQDLLGVNSNEANRMFNGDLSRNQVIHVAKVTAKSYGHELNII